jgi:hypothetical protein
MKWAMGIHATARMRQSTMGMRGGEVDGWEGTDSASQGQPSQVGTYAWQGCLQPALVVYPVPATLGSPALFGQSFWRCCWCTRACEKLTLLLKQLI